MFSVENLSAFPDATVKEVIVYDDFSLSVAHATLLIGMSTQTFKSRYGEYPRHNPKPNVYKGQNNRTITWCISFSNFAKVLKAEEWPLADIERAIQSLYSAIPKSSLEVDEDEEKDEEKALPARKRTRDISPPIAEKQRGAPKRSTRATNTESGHRDVRVNALSVKMGKNLFCATND